MSTKQSSSNKGAKAQKRITKRASKNIPMGIAFVNATFNNTIISITDPIGQVVAWSSAGKNGYSGSRKSSAFAATIAAQDAGKLAAAHGMREVEVRLKGPGAGRESAVRGLQSAGLCVTSITDETPVPHNGCRARKRRRV